MSRRRKTSKEAWEDMTMEEFRLMTDGISLKLIARLTGRCYVSMSHYHRGVSRIPRDVEQVVRELYAKVLEVEGRRGMGRRCVDA